MLVFSPFLVGIVTKLLAEKSEIHVFLVDVQHETSQISWLKNINNKCFISIPSNPDMDTIQYTKYPKCTDNIYRRETTHTNPKFQKYWIHFFESVMLNNSLRPCNCTCIFQEVNVKASLVLLKREADRTLSLSHFDYCCFWYAHVVSKFCVLCNC